MGGATVGAVLQNRLVASLHDQAVSYASQLPPQVRQPFVEGFSSTAGGGLEVGRRSSSAGGQNLANLPPQAQHQIAQVAHDVFLYGFIYAMRPTLAVPIVALAIGAFSCIGIRRFQRPGGVEARPAEQEETAVPAA